jgi:hypothetical protein
MGNLAPYSRPHDYLTPVGADNACYDLHSDKEALIYEAAIKEAKARSMATEIDEAAAKKVPAMHKFRDGDKVLYKGEIVIVKKVYPYEDDCSICFPSSGNERNVKVSNLTAAALEDFSKGALFESAASNEVVILASFSRLREIFLRLMLLIITLFGSILFVTAASSVPARHEFSNELLTCSSSVGRLIYDANGASVVRFANNTPKQPTPFRQLRYRFPLQV